MPQANSHDSNKLGLNDWIKDAVDKEEAEKAAKEEKKNGKKTDGSPPS